MRRPPIIWQQPGAYWAAQLRGLRYFSHLSADVQIVRGQTRVRVTPQSVFFWYMPVENRASRYRMVADVTADVLGLMPEPTLAMRAAHDQKATVESTTYWRRPEILTGHAEALRAATLITTSWAEMVEPLFDFANCPVVYLPDYQGRFGWAFRRAMRTVWRELEACPIPMRKGMVKIDELRV